MYVRFGFVIFALILGALASCKSSDKSSQTKGGIIVYSGKSGRINNLLFGQFEMINKTEVNANAKFEYEIIILDANYDDIPIEGTVGLWSTKVIESGEALEATPDHKLQLIVSSVEVQNKYVLETRNKIVTEDNSEISAVTITFDGASVYSDIESIKYFGFDVDAENITSEIGTWKPEENSELPGLGRCKEVCNGNVVNCRNNVSSENGCRELQFATRFRCMTDRVFELGFSCDIETDLASP
ncbi:MAG: hypothetical protein KBD78_11015 [Oligoflexales bacterium]|nr:hypothetical protein [Oligoflexales bacterium]